jgi:hypothetical protein
MSPDTSRLIGSRVDANSTRPSVDDFGCFRASVEQIGISQPEKPDVAVRLNSGGEQPTQPRGCSPLFYFGDLPTNEEAPLARREEHLTVDDQRVLTRKEWAKLNSLSFETAKRILMRGDGPPVVQLSARRIGIRMIDNRRWQEARLRT